MIYVVLGAHKSGTTLVSQILHESGINMGDFGINLGYDEGNQYERHEVVALNRAYLCGCLLPPLSFFLRKPFLPALNSAGYAPNADSVAIVRAIPREVPGGLQQQASSLVSTLSANYSDWGFKDPRTCLTYHIWSRFLPQHVVIFVYRSIVEILQRYNLQGVGQLHIPRLLRVLHVWTVYNQQVLHYLEENRVRHLVISYRKLMTGSEEMERLTDFVGFPLRDLRKPEKYRNRQAGASVEGMPLTGRWLGGFLPSHPYNTLEALDIKRGEQL